MWGYVGGEVGAREHSELLACATRLQHPQLLRLESEAKKAAAKWEAAQWAAALRQAACAALKEGRKDDAVIRQDSSAREGRKVTESGGSTTSLLLDTAIHCKGACGGQASSRVPVFFSIVTYS